MVEGLGPIVDIERGIGRGVARRDQLIGGGRLPDGRGRCGAALVAAIEQRVFLHLGPDERLELDIGQRKQLDRLLQLDGHDQRLGLAQVEARTDAHRPIPPGGGPRG